MASINHSCDCGEVWSDNEVINFCPACSHMSRGEWDEERTQYIRDEVSEGEEND